MIWIIAGTRDARRLIKTLLEKGLSVLATTATDYGKDLLNDNDDLIIESGKLNQKGMEELITKYGINQIIDASHPYATEVSENAIKVSKISGIGYLRYEREPVYYEDVSRFREYQDAAEYLKNGEGNILFAIGTKNLPQFSGIDSKRIFVRIVPFRTSIMKCDSLGIKPGNIVAMSFNFSKEFNMALFSELDIRYLVTKESGVEGGIREKVDAARELGIEVILIERPHVVYPDICHTQDEILTWLTGKAVG